MAYSLGLDFIDDGRSFLPIDVDGDGDLDVAFISLQTLRFMENRADELKHHFARFLLRAQKTQQHALGAEVTVESGGVAQRDYVKVTAGFQTQVPYELHFGLGQFETMDKVTVHWPSGGVQVFNNLQHGRRYVLEEGRAEPLVQEIKKWNKDTTPNNSSSLSLAGKVETLEGKKEELSPQGKPTVLNFWAPWCKPCQRELPELVSLNQEMGEEIALIGVSVEVENKAQVKNAVKKYGLKYKQYFSNEDLMQRFFGSDGTAPLPSTFIFDAKGQLRRAFYRAVGKVDLVPLLESLRSEPPHVDNLLPLIMHHIQQRNFKEAEVMISKLLKMDLKNSGHLMRLGNALAMGGQYNRAVSVLEKTVALDPGIPYAWYALSITYHNLGRPDEALAALEKANKMEPDNIDFLSNLGAAYSQRKELMKAQKVFEKMVQVAPDNATAWLNLGKVRVMLKLPTSTSAFRKVLELDTNQGEAKALLKAYGPKRDPQ